MIEKIRCWTYNQQCLGKQGDHVNAVLKAVIGVYSAHPSGPLSLWARTNNFAEEAFYHLDTSKSTCRLPAMRTSVYMLPKETAHKIFAATIEPASSGVWEKRYSEDGRKVPVEFYDEWKEDILNLTKEPLTVKELKPLTTVPDEKLKFVLNRMAFEGYILRVGAKSLRSNIISYASTEARGATFGQLGMADAQAWLAGAYLKAFGPARVKDFKWWAGIKASEAKEAMATQNTIDLGDGYLILKEDVADFDKSPDSLKDQFDILPQWDCYTMGYAPDGRDRLIDKEMLPRLYGKLGATGGNALGAIMVNGLVEGVWTSRFKGSKMEVSLDLFKKPGKRLKSKIENTFQEIALMLKAKQVLFEEKK